MRGNPTWSRGEAETAAALAATMNSDERFDGWMERWRDQLSGWCGFIALCLELAPAIEQRACALGGWDVCDWYLTLDAVATAIFNSEDLDPQVQTMDFPR